MRRSRGATAEDEDNVLDGVLLVDSVDSGRSLVDFVASTDRSRDGTGCMLRTLPVVGAPRFVDLGLLAMYLTVWVLCASVAVVVARCLCLIFDRSF